MKKLLLTIPLLTLVFIMSINVNAEFKQIHDWITPQEEQTANDPLTGYAQKWSIKGASAADRWDPDRHYSQAYGGVSLYVDATFLNAGKEENVISWIEATSDWGLVDTPSKDGVRTNKQESDWKNRDYFTDSKSASAPIPEDITDTESFIARAITSYKSHPVAVYYDNDINPILAVGEKIVRNFSHDAWAYAWHSVAHRSDLDKLSKFNPYATGSLDVSSRSHVNLPIGIVSFTTPWTDDDSDEEANAPSMSPGLYILADADTITIDGEEMLDTKPGDTVTVNLVMPSDRGYAKINWYLSGNELGDPTTPSGTGIETEVWYTFSMPSDASGVYTFKAYIYPHSSASDGSVYEYTIKINCD